MVGEDFLAAFLDQGALQQGLQLQLLLHGTASDILDQRGECYAHGRRYMPLLCRVQAAEWDATGAGQGRQVLWVWDQAGVDFAFWQERTASGICFLSLRKEGMCLEVETERVIDVTPPINQGVTADRVLTDRRGIRIREITFCNPCDGEVYVYLPTELTLEPGPPDEVTLRLWLPTA